MNFSSEKTSKAVKIAVNILIITGLCSALLFIPQIRNLLILLGEKLIGRPLNHEAWHSLFLEVETALFCFICICVLSYYAATSKKFEKIEMRFYAVFSWIFVVLSSIALIVLACQSRDVWVDETFSLGMVTHPLWEIVTLTAKDCHPPLYYFILKIAMTIFPGSVSAAKIVSAIPVILILCIANLFFKKEFSYKHGLLFNALLLSINVVMVHAIDIRMYTWCMLFCFLCCLCTYYIHKKGELKYFLLFVLFAECGAWSQYWTAFGLAINFVLISILCLSKDKKSLKYILISAALGILLYLPWAKAVLSQFKTVSKDFWISPVTFATVKGYILSLIPLEGKYKIIMCLLLLFCMITASIKLFQKDNEAAFDIICVASPFLLISCALAITFLVRPLFLYRYGLPLCVFVIFFIARRVTQLKYQKFITAFLILASLLCFTRNYISNFKCERKTNQNHTAFEKMMSENLTEDTVFIFGDNIHFHLPLCLAYSYPKNKMYESSRPESWDLNLWTSVYNYNPKDLITDLEGETDLCFIANHGNTVPDKFKDADCYSAVPYYYFPMMDFYFKKGK